ncbi:hypothetical protein LshimejAT787_1205340 [Lyophyllum shimeji]|uniref:DUF5648 domain-containing protein n=1 Tax=Lyophyllum shimeji TaxID=47721 RepID=A0A9P3PW32_LYOSH|nr:hypothetical protein LshimejAT787_1205340 [Lyophyllum shimeji]
MRFNFVSISSVIAAFSVLAVQAQRCADPRQATPWFRAFNPSVVDHFYTANRQEWLNAINNLGYNNEGIAAYIFRNAQPGTVPFYRLYSSQGTDHFYTRSLAERNNAIRNLGYAPEGITGWIYPNASCGGVPLFRLFQPTEIDHFYTTLDFAFLGLIELDTSLQYLSVELPAWIQNSIVDKIHRVHEDFAVHHAKSRETFVQTITYFPSYILCAPSRPGRLPYFSAKIWISPALNTGAARGYSERGINVVLTTHVIKELKAPSRRILGSLRGLLPEKPLNVGCHHGCQIDPDKVCRFCFLSQTGSTCARARSPDLDGTRKLLLPIRHSHVEILTA